MVDQTDSDSDNIPDRIELWYQQQGYGMDPNDPADAAGDLDGDGYSNLHAYQNSWSLVSHLVGLYDADNDGIPDVLEDAWSARYAGLLSKTDSNDAVQDYDGDGVMNFEEISAGMDPSNPHSRSSNVDDLQEWNWLRHFKDGDATWQVLADTDNDGVADGLQAFITANSVALPVRVSTADCDGDGMPDLWEYRYHLDLRDSTDATGNSDVDSLTNLQEFLQSRDPLVFDDPSPPQITTASLPDGTVGSAYTASVQAVDGAPPYQFSGSGLPSGLTLDSTGSITGTPDASGGASFMVTVTDLNGLSATQDLSINVSSEDTTTCGDTTTTCGDTTTTCDTTTNPPPDLAITTTTLDTGMLGAGYSAAITAANGTAPYTFSIPIIQGDTGLPFGYDLASDGTLTGIVDSTGSQTAGTYTFTVQVDDNAGLTTTKQLTLVLESPVDTTTGGDGTGTGTGTGTGGDGTGTGTGGDGTTGGQDDAEDPDAISVSASDMSGVADSAFSGGISASGGVLPYQFSCSLPAGLSMDADTGVISGTPTSSGTFSALAGVVDSTGAEAAQDFTITIAEATNSNGGTGGSSGTDNTDTSQNGNGGTTSTPPPPATTPPKILSVSFKSAPSIPDVSDEVQKKNSPIILTSDDVGDDQVTYSEPHWQADDNGVQRNYPVAYVAGGTPYVEVEINVGNNATNASGVTKIQCKADSSLTLDQNQVILYLNDQNKAVLKLTAFPDMARFYNADEEGKEFTLNWEIQRPGDTAFVSAGSTKHTLYVVKTQPIKTAASNKMESLYNISCRGADGQSTEAAIVQGIWAEFQDCKVYRAQPSSGNQREMPMTYWNGGVYTRSGGTSASLLSNADGRCGDWCRLFIDCLRLHGIDSDDQDFESSYFASGEARTKMASDTSAIGFEIASDATLKSILFVQSWSSPNQGDNGFQYNHAGKQAQGDVPDPMGVFLDHCLILCNGVLYDPSYGKTWESQLAWENNGLSGFGSSVPVVDQVPYKPGLRLNWFGESKVAGNNEEETFNNPLANY